MKHTHTNDRQIFRLGLYRIIWLCLLLGFASVVRSETIIWQDNFDDGAGDNRWTVDGTGTWQIGSPTVGPQTNAVGTRTFSGTQCATTGLMGNYLPNQNTRLIRIASFPVPAANQSPRLRFWQWYSIGGGDSGVVEVKPVGSNTWTAISPTYTTTGSGIWTRPSIDLSAYAGQTIQIAFRFTSDNGFNGGESTGWYLDDIALVTGTPVFNSPEGFESGLGDWSAEKGTWQIGVPTVGPPTNIFGVRAFAGTNCAATVLGGNYAGSIDSRLVSPVFPVPAANQSPRLRFWQWYSIGGGDSGAVEVKPVGSNTWTAISATYTTTGSGIWTRPSIDLSAYAGQTIQIAFRFTSDNGFNGGESTGWYLDDIALVTGTPVFNSPEGFESGLGDWSAERGTWQIGEPTVGPGSGYASSNCAATVLGGNYAANIDTRLISPTVTLPSAAASPAFRFRNWYSMGGGDSLYLEIKNVSSNAWTTLATYTGSSGGWTYPFIDLTTYSLQAVQFAFRITSDNGFNGGENSGWFVDDILIFGFVPPPLITQPPASQSVGIESPVTLAVVVTGTGPFTYQWYFNETNALAGATSSNYFIANAQLTNAGNYSVIVSNAGGAVSSPLAMLTVRPLPFNLTNDFVGANTFPGSAEYANGIFTIIGSGEDIENTADAFQFVHQPLIGDGQIVARILSVQGPAGAESGLMIRESLADGSKHAFLRVNSATNVVFRRRIATNDYSVDTSFSGTNYSWLRLTRLGNTFVGHCSTNGTDWKYVWFTTVDMANQVQIGLAVTAHQNGQYATGRFDNVSIGSVTPLSGVWPSPGPQILLGGELTGGIEFQRVGGFKMLVGGSVGDILNLRGSPDVGTPSASWPVLGTVTNTNGVVPFLDIHALTNVRTFYRAEKVEP